ncbi:MAG: ATP-binding protein [Paludibacteraceae bacterium]|nr:ATP-binding protein [Paludibacteraceae bacterium]
MKFYGRNQEINRLLELDVQAKKTSVFTLLIGRRRIGKTTLLKQTFTNKRMLYFFVSQKSEQLLCQELQQTIEAVLGIHLYGQISKFADLLRELMIYSIKDHITFIIDEFQRLHDINSSIMSEIQNVWDSNKDKSHIHLIACGSVYTMMMKIFRDKKEPLFGRATAEIRLQPFTTQLLKNILSDYNTNYSPEDLLTLYTLSGGVAKYVELLMDANATNMNAMIDFVCQDGSVFLNEGTELLIGEFGKRYQVYFSIMQLIANSMTTQSQIDSVVGFNTGRYIATLEDEYNLIQKVRPMLAKPNSQGIKFALYDNFLTFWFRFIESNRSIVEMGKTDLLKEIIYNGYDQFSGIMLERYFRQQYSEMERVTEVSHWWDTRSENEIDLIAVERLDKRVIVGEVKRNAKKINLKKLEEKFAQLRPHFRGYEIKYTGLSLENM